MRTSKNEGVAYKTRESLQETKNQCQTAHVLILGLIDLPFWRIIFLFTKQKQEYKSDVIDPTLTATATATTGPTS